jgi:hypothetical protein
LLPLTLVIWVYAYISIAFVLVLSCSVVMPPILLLLLLGMLQAGILPMTSSILQGGLLNTTKEEGVLSERSHSSARG